MALRADVDIAEFLSSGASGMEWSEKAECKHQCEQSWKAQHPTLSAPADAAKSNFSIQGGDCKKHRFLKSPSWIEKLDFTGCASFENSFHQS